MQKDNINKEDSLDLTLRPKTWDDYVGQEKVKQNVKIIVEAAKQREEPSVEHLLFYGNPGLGKCINKESILFTEKGMLPIGKIGNLDKKKFQPKRIKVYSNSGPVFSSHFYNNGISQTIKITTHQKYEIEGTHNHQIVALEKKGKATFKQLRNLKKGDYVAIQRGHNFFGNVTKLPKFNFNPSQFNTCDYNKYVIPAVLTEKLGRILGYLTGDGYIGDKSGKGTVQFYNENQKVLKDFQKIWLKIFNQQTKIQKWQKKCSVIRTGNVKIREFLINIGLPYSTARTKKIPACIMQAPKQIVREFLKGYFECDGHLRKACRAAEVNSASRILLKQVQIILLNFGIISRVYKSHKGGTKKRPNPNWRLTITGEDVDIFLKKVGFITLEKMVNRKHYSPIHNTNKDLVPFAKEKIKDIRQCFVALNKILEKKQYRYSVKKHVSNRAVEKCIKNIEITWDKINELVAELKQISNEHIFWDVIEKKEKSTAHTVDLSIPTNHNFFANGFINHNTTIAHIVAREIGADIKITSGPAIERPGDLAAVLTNLTPGSVLFIDEIHRLSKVIEEYLYPAMEDFKLNLIIGSGPMARTMTLDVPRFTLIGATTRLAAISSPLRSRFGASFGLNFYTLDDIEQILKRSARVLNIETDHDAFPSLAKCSRFTPRVANHILKRVRDFAQVKGQGKITKQIASIALSHLEIDELGLTINDRRILETMITKFGGGPVGLQALAAATAEEQETILDIYEPYLMRLGFIARTPKGRLATKLAYQHLNIKPLKNQNPLF